MAIRARAEGGQPMKTFLAAATLAAILLLASSWDYHDARAEAQHYQDMVCGGYWPDYKDMRPTCGGNHE